MNDKYTAEDIVVLRGLESVRRRPEMYVGKLDDPETQTCLIVQGMCHGLDQLETETATRLIVDFIGEITMVVDNGAGMPIVKPDGQDLYAPEIIMSVLHTCKAERVNDGIRDRFCTSGLACLTALSESMELSTCDGGQVYEQEFNRGISNKPVIRKALHWESGTSIVFKLDSQFFPRLANPTSLASMEKRMVEMRKIVPGLILCR